MSITETRDEYWRDAGMPVGHGKPRFSQREQNSPADGIPSATGPEEFGLPPEGNVEPDFVGIDTSHSTTLERRFTPVAIDDVRAPEEPEWAIEELLPARGLACIVGKPKSGKSYLATDAFFHIARGVEYAGRKTLQGLVVYLTGEGVSGFKKRLIEMNRHYGTEGEGVPFFMVDDAPDLGSESTDVHQLIAELDEFLGANNLRPPRVIALDTLARCMGGGDENSARDMGRFVNRCSEIERHFGCLVAVVHHFGKDQARGGRGSNALNGAADVTWSVEKFESHRRVTVDEMKDGAEGATWQFRLVPAIKGGSATDPDVAVSTSCFVELLSQPASAQQGATSKPREPKGVDGDLLKIIRRAVDEAGQVGLAPSIAPRNAKAVSIETLKTYCKSMGWQDDKQANSFRSVLSRSLSALRSKDMIGRNENLVWLTI